MTEPGDTARPGIAPGSLPTAGTMIAALYGELTPHAWRGPQPELDAYALFHQRSLAMGWADDRSAGGDSIPDSRRAAGLWQMNDAGWHHPRTAGSDLVSWFQVTACAVAADRPLPVQPLLRCAQAATERAGRLTLSAVQVLLPVQGLDPSTRPIWAPTPAVSSAPWFRDGDPLARTTVRVRVDGGQDPSIQATGAQLGDLLQALDQAVFTGSRHADPGATAARPTPFDDRAWNGPARHGVALHGVLAEWSGDAIGWLAEAVADCAARLGVRSPLLLMVSRAG